MSYVHMSKHSEQYEPYNVHTIYPSKMADGGAGADRREDTYLKGYIVSLFALPEAAATPPWPWARTSEPNTPARRLHSTAHPLTPPLGGAAP